MPSSDEKTLAGLPLSFGLMTNKLSKTIDNCIDSPFTLPVFKKLCHQESAHQIHSQLQGDGALTIPG